MLKKKLSNYRIWIASISVFSLLGILQFKHPTLFPMSLLGLVGLVSLRVRLFPGLLVAAASCVLLTIVKLSLSYPVEGQWPEFVGEAVITGLMFFLIPYVVHALELSSYALYRGRSRYDSEGIGNEVSSGAVVPRDGNAFGYDQAAEESYRPMGTSRLPSKTLEQYSDAAQRVAALGIWEWSLGERLWWSDELCRIYGQDPSTYKPTLSSFLKFLPDEEKPSMERKIEETLAGLNEYKFEHRVVLEDGTEKWLYTEGFVDRNGTGKPLRMWGVCQDITAKKRSERALRENEERFRLAFDHSPIGIILRSAEKKGKITRANPAFCEMLGYAADQVINHDLNEFCHQDDSYRHDRLESSMLRGDLVDFRLEKRFIAKDGQTVVTQVTSALVQGSDQTSSYILSMIEDITERKNAERALEQREQYFRLVLDRMPIGCIMHAPDFSITYWNPACQHIFGFSAADVLGRQPQALLFPDSIGTGESVLEQGIRRGESDVVRIHRNVTKDGKQIWCEWHNTPLIDKDGEFVGFLAMVEDISALREARQTAEESHRLYQLLADTMSDIVCLTKRDLSIAYISPSCERILGAPSDYYLQQEPREWIHTDDSASYLNALNQAFTGKNSGIEYRLRHRSGKYVWVETLFSPVVDSHGATNEVIGCTRDISNRRFLEEQVRQSQKLEAVGRLAGGVAHDFNNLLTIVNSYSQLLRENLPVDSAEHEMANNIQLAGERGAALIRQLLAFSRNQIIRVETINVNSVIEDLRPMLQRLLGSDLTLTPQLSEESNHVVIDRSQWEQVLMNLVVNARDAMPRGGSIRILTESLMLDEENVDLPQDCAPGNYVHLAVIDSGVGIDSQTLPKIFEPFFTTKPVGKGTGLGLSTVYGIVRQSHGFTKVESEPGLGTSVHVYLPRVAGGKNEVPVSSTQFLSRGRERVLLVEDDHAVRGLATRLLRGQGYEVTAMESGALALQVFQTPNHDFDLVLTDVVMPEMGGAELAERILALKPDTRIIFMSGYSDDLYEERGISLQPERLLVKPFSGEDLARIVRSVLDQSVVGKEVHESPK